MRTHKTPAMNSRSQFSFFLYDPHIFVKSWEVLPTSSASSMGNSTTVGTAWEVPISCHPHVGTILPSLSHANSCFPSLKQQTHFHHTHTTTQHSLTNLLQQDHRFIHSFDVRAVQSLGEEFHCLRHSGEKGKEEKRDVSHLGAWESPEEPTALLQAATRFPSRLPPGT